jgi:hypothetical protein
MFHLGDLLKVLGIEDEIGDLLQLLHLLNHYFFWYRRMDRISNGEVLSCPSYEQEIST